MNNDLTTWVGGGSPVRIPPKQQRALAAQQQAIIAKVQMDALEMDGDVALQQRSMLQLADLYDTAKAIAAERPELAALLTQKVVNYAHLSDQRIQRRNSPFGF